MSQKNLFGSSEDSEQSGFDLFDRSRDDDPITSKIADAKLEELRESQIEILRVLYHEGTATYEELISACYKHKVQQSRSGIRTRCKELREKGIVEDTGETRETRAGNPAKVWKVSDDLDVESFLTQEEGR